MVAGRPNVLMIVFDDLGFADLGCFGSTVETPNLDRLAAEGLRYTDYHTAPVCCPARASILTGRNHHAVGWGSFGRVDTSGAYSGRIPASAATIGRILQGDGYRTGVIGKWHNTPWPDLGDAAAWSADARPGDGTTPTAHWPLAMGFDAFYGFLGGMTDHYDPNLVRGDELVDPPRTPAEGYHLTEDLVDESIRFVDEAGDAPFFLYFAPGAVHAPHQAPREWIERYRGRFDHGWDAERRLRYERQLELGVIPEGTALTERPGMVPAWDDLDDRDREVFVRQMEVFAGFAAHTDAQIGRLIDQLAANGVLDDTIVIVIADNGASGETLNGAFDMAGYFSDGELENAAAHLEDFGAPGSFNWYASGWALAGTTPLRMWKFYTWLGGVRVPLIVRWPAGIPESERGSTRRQFAHAIDLVPTILDVAAIPVPAEVDGVVQQPIDGASIRATFAGPDVPAARATQYFEMYGSRAIFHDGWKATTDHVPATDYHAGGPAGWRGIGSVDFATDRWSLFDLRSDFSEAHDLADEDPARLAEMVGLWEAEAQRNHVHPMVDTLGWVKAAE